MAKRWRRRGDNFKLREAKLNRALDAGTPMAPTRSKKVCPAWFRTTRANKPRTKSDTQLQAGA